jgi:uncharacterized protein
MNILYLHGFASSPQSSKAQFFSRKFAEAGISFTAPQLDQGDFEKLTITGMLQVIAESLPGDSQRNPIVLMGSSLGGYMAALYASRHPEKVERLVLLAPAFQFPRRWRERFSQEDWERWKLDGSLPFFHYASKTEQRLGFSFVEDVAKYEDEPSFPQPALILHGTLDNVVPPAVSRQFVASHPNARLVEFLSGHELTDVLDPMWRETAAFLELIC